jgi:small-conductance mechanosensitive channel
VYPRASGPPLEYADVPLLLCVCEKRTVLVQAQTFQQQSLGPPPLGARSSRGDTSWAGFGVHSMESPSWLADTMHGLLCCTRRKAGFGNAEEKEYTDLRAALQKKQEEVRALQEEVDALTVPQHQQAQQDKAMPAATSSSILAPGS